MSKILKEINFAAEAYRSFFKESNEIPQNVLAIKSHVCHILQKDNPEKYYTIREGECFGISEMLVNQLMVHAFEKGRQAGFSEGKDAGYEAAMADVKEDLGL